ncbi:MAG TPA: hypothetical protein VFH50_01705 [Acidimicrobiales bacterium]|nr:hypothetical protein [Acidimicrobiales bacterium]
MAPGRRILLGGLLVLAAAGCGVAHPQDLNFTVDKRLQFQSPPARALVAAPVTVRWTMAGFRVEPEGSAPSRPDAGYFAVFVDRAPIRPGQTMRAVATGDQVCLHQAGCPDAAYLAARQIYTTTATSLTLQQIPPLSGNVQRVQYHSVTVVLMDTTGHRIGESAWELDLRTRRAGI